MYYEFQPTTRDGDEYVLSLVLQPDPDRDPPFKFDLIDGTLFQPPGLDQDLIRQSVSRMEFFITPQLVVSRDRNGSIFLGKTHLIDLPWPKPPNSKFSWTEFWISNNRWSSYILFSDNIRLEIDNEFLRIVQTERTLSLKDF